MAAMIKITGIDKILRNMDRASADEGKKLEKNLKRAGLFTQRESQKIVPVDQSNLKASAGTRNIGGAGFDADVVVFYNAEYAVYVHEDLNARHKPGKQAKYLESVVREKKDELFAIAAGNL